MAETLEVTYRGYAVAYSENQDVWRCWSLDVEGERLPTVRAKIDKVIAAARKLDNPIPVIYVNYQDQPVPVRIMSLAQPGKDRRTQQEKEPDAAWCMVPGEERYFDHEKRAAAYRPVEKREKLPLSMLYVDSPENREALAEAQRMQAEIIRLTEKRKETLKAMSLVGTAIFKIADVAEEENA